MPAPGAASGRRPTSCGPACCEDATCAEASCTDASSARSVDICACSDAISDVSAPSVGTGVAGRHVLPASASSLVVSWSSWETEADPSAATSSLAPCFSGSFSTSASILCLSSAIAFSSALLAALCFAMLVLSASAVDSLCSSSISFIFLSISAMTRAASCVASSFSLEASSSSLTGLAASSAIAASSAAASACSFTDRTCSSTVSDMSTAPFSESSSVSSFVSSLPSVAFLSRDPSSTVVIRCCSGPTSSSRFGSGSRSGASSSSECGSRTMEGSSKAGDSSLSAALASWVDSAGGKTDNGKKRGGGGAERTSGPRPNSRGRGSTPPASVHSGSSTTWA
mmetsp:Transcript_23047/g.57049  ORF Transcript_23047/g.57049 Transcript_23047/m.57049 type:complete len:340 (+) Transcript_23047:60-1079(+)